MALELRQRTSARSRVLLTLQLLMVALLVAPHELPVGPCVSERNETACVHSPRHCVWTATGCIAPSPPPPTRLNIEARACVPGKATQQWTLSPEVKPGSKLATQVRLTSQANHIDSKSCWKVLECSNKKVLNTLGCGAGCTPMPTKAGACAPGKSGGNCNCNCNCAFNFNANGTITTVMDGQCLSMKPEMAQRAGKSPVGFTRCVDDPTQKWELRPIEGRTNVYTIGQPAGDADAVDMCVDSVGIPYLPPPDTENESTVRLFVDPVDGNDLEDGRDATKPIRTLRAAKAAVRRHLRASKGDIEVLLLPGRHLVHGDPLVLEGIKDSPLEEEEHRAVTWRSLDPHNPAIVDGGVLITNWQPSTRPELVGKHALVAAVPASIPRDAKLRHLWVNGVRAERSVQYAVNLDGRSPGGLNISAQLPSDPCCPGPGAACNCTAYVQTTSEGFDFTGSAVDPSVWTNPQDVEFVFHFPGYWTPWIEPRCLVDSVDGHRAVIRQPCWSDLHRRIGGYGPFALNHTDYRSVMPPPAAIENVGFANLTAPGSFYYDRINHTITYLPRPGETAKSIMAYTTVQEVLLQLNRTRNVAWHDVSYKHATWDQVAADKGYVDWQGGYSGGYGTWPEYHDCYDRASCAVYADSNGCGSTTKPAPHCVDNRGLSPPGNVRVFTGRNVTFMSCTFQHLGGIYAISVNYGSQHIGIKNSTFTDLSGGAIQVGSLGSRWTTGPLCDPESADCPPAAAALKSNHRFRGEHDYHPLLHNIVRTKTPTAHKSKSQVAAGPNLVATECTGERSQQWVFSPGFQPWVSDTDGTIVELAGSNTSDALGDWNSQRDMMCWRALGCSDKDGAPVGCGKGCTPLPGCYANGSYACEEGVPGGRCNCNGAFSFQKDATIRSEMPPEKHCLQIVAGSKVELRNCTGAANQKFGTTLHATPTAYSIWTQNAKGHKLCIQSPPPPPPPAPPCNALHSMAACTASIRHCTWNSTLGSCTPPPPPPHPPPQPFVNKVDMDLYYTLEDNWIVDATKEYHGAIGIFAGYIANSSISHNTIQRVSYDGIQFGWGWGQQTFAGNTKVANNSIEDVLPYQADGGCIYSQSPQHFSSIEGNFLQRDGNRFGMIYTDGASQVRIVNNVLNHGNAPCVFIHGGGQDPVGQHWYNDTGKPDLCCGSVPNGVDVATVLHDINGSKVWPPQAQAIVDNAGRRV